MARYKVTSGTYTFIINDYIIWHESTRFRFRIQGSNANQRVMKRTGKARLIKQLVKSNIRVIDHEKGLVSVRRSTFPIVNTSTRPNLVEIRGNSRNFGTQIDQMVPWLEMLPHFFNTRVCEVF